MPIPMPLPRAEAIIQQHQAGMSLPTIAQHMRLSVWLLMSDEYSGAILYESVFPCSEGQALSAQQVQASLGTCLSRWGLPQVLRVDNGDA